MISFRCVMLGNSAIGKLYGLVFNLKLFEFLKELIIIDISLFV